jgi:hypothetical protein
MKNLETLVLMVRIMCCIAALVGVKIAFFSRADYAGSECRKRNSELECIIPRLKDWNDDLKALLKQS